MAHLILSRRASFNSLVSLVRDYNNKMKASEDVFEKAEYYGFLLELKEYCLYRGGRDLLDRVFSEAGVNQGAGASYQYK